jgi:glyoxylase-like metal-dependent hydrolase (beta-lactamase superfamily II)
MEVEIGRGRVTIVHVPGHTPGSVCLKLGRRALVGDAVFPGGPGYTATPDALAQSLISLGQTVFRWPKGTRLHPGHGDSTTVGAERKPFEAFLEADHPEGLCGDVRWR